MSKTILLIVRRHAGEIDWILPLLHRFKNKNKIITIFSNKDAFLSLKNNKTLFLLWTKICKEYTIEKKSNRFFWKVLDFLLNKLASKNYNNTTFRNYIITRIFNIEKTIYKKFFLNNVDLVFIEHGNPTYLPNVLKEKDKNTKIIRFPESTMFFANKKENPFFKNKRKVFNTYGDIFLFCSKNNMEHFFSGENYKKISPKIIYSNQLRYEDWWKKKFLRKKSKNKYFTILVALRNFNNDYFHKKSYYKTLDDICSLTKNLKDIKLIFKIHPQEINENQLKKDINVLDKKNYIITKDHMMTLSVEADLCISILTSACFDSIISNVPTIEYYDVKKEIKLSPKAKEFLHLTYEKKNKKWSTVFKFNKILKNVDNYEELLKEIRKIKLQKKINKNQHNSYHEKLVNLSNYGKSSLDLYNLLKKIN